MLSLIPGTRIPPRETVRAARILLESVDVPPDPAALGPALVLYVDGKRGSGQPVENLVRVGDIRVLRPDLGSVEVRAVRIEHLSRQRPGDCTQDAAIDISDPICLLNYFFIEVTARLPCGDGSGTDPANIALLDANADGTLDLSDAVSIILFLFAGGPPPGRGTECVRILGCPDACS